MKKSFLSVILTVIVLCTLLCSCTININGLKDTDENISTVEEKTNSKKTAKTTSSKSDIVGKSDDREYTFDHVSITLPEGFKVDDEGTVIYAVPEEYPLVTDNITFVKDKYSDIDVYSEQYLSDYYSTILNGFGGSRSFEKTTVSGHDAVIYSYDITLNGVDMIGMQIMLFGSDYTDTVTFTSVTGSYDDAFEACMDSVTVD